jgi:tetratricopeptide (TPR) repeat protein
LIRVEDPVVEPGLGHLTVLGSAGQVFGLGFYETPGEHAALLAAADPIAQIESRGHWSVFYGSIMELPLGDADLWAEHCLPVAGDQAYPVAVWLGPGEGVRRPDLRILDNLEAVLLALAGTSEDEIDRGRWTRQAETLSGPKTVTLCIPALLEPLDAPVTGNPSGMPDRRIMERTLAEMERFMATSDFHDLDEANAALQSRFAGSMDAMPSTAATPLEKAQDLVYRAFDARGRRKIQLVRKALELSPDCADAYVALAEQATDGEAARDLYAQGVAAGERALGPAMFEQEVGHFWGLTSSRPYMRARFGLARCLEEQGRTGDAIGHYHELLRLNPDDNQGVRDVLLPVLLIAKRDAEAGALLSRYGEDSGALWQYAGALWAFRQEGDSPAARDRLRAALRANRHVAKYLTGKSKEPETLPESYAFGSAEEAMLCAHDLGPAWRATPGAVRWLNDSRPKSKRKPHTRPRR